MATKKLRILALHGGYQNGTIFGSKRIKDLQRRLRDIAEFVAVDGPILATPADELINERRSWFNWDEHDPERFEEYIHLDALTWWKFEETCRYLDELWVSMGPFDGVLGFSQGAETASVWIDQRLRHAADYDSQPKFLIAISAFLHPKPLNYPEYATAPLITPSLHVIGLLDEYIPPARSLELAQLYSDATVYQHEGGHVVPQKPADCEVFRSFLSRFIE